MQPRRVGFSATLGDYSVAEEWLRSRTDKLVITPEIEGRKRQIKLALEHFYVGDRGELRETNRRDAEDAKTRGERDGSGYEEYVFNLSKSGKCLIFANNKTQNEVIGRDCAQHFLFKTKGALKLIQ